MDPMEDVKIEDVKGEMQATKGRAIETLLHGARMAAGAFALLRTLERYVRPKRALRYFGLYRRRPLWKSAAIAGASALAGAGIAMLVSPTSGREARQSIARAARRIGRRGRSALREAGSEIQEGIAHLQEETGRKPEEAGQKGNGHEQQGREQPQT